ncbi:MAG: nitroreductase [Burkholderiaceae bacterium]
MMDESDGISVLEDLLRNRHSCRAFLPRQIPRQTIESILGVAQRTASWCNTQPWQVVVTSGQATDRFRKALVDQLNEGLEKPDFDFPLEYTGVYQSRRRVCGYQLYDSVGVKKEDRAASTVQMLKNFEFFGAPHLAIISAPASLGVYGAVDCGAYVNNFMLAAHGAGVATIAQASLALYASFIRQYFDIDSERQILCGISFGYEDVDHPVNGFRTEREDLDKVVRWEGDRPEEQ